MFFRRHKNVNPFENLIALVPWEKSGCVIETVNKDVYEKDPTKGNGTFEAELPFIDVFNYIQNHPGRQFYFEKSIEDAVKHNSKIRHFLEINDFIKFFK